MSRSIEANKVTLEIHWNTDFTDFLVILEKM